MTNPIKGETPLTLADGRELVLVLDFDALVEAETVYGKPMRGLMSDVAAGFMGASRALLFGALKRRQPTLGLADVGEMFLTDAAAVALALEAAVKSGFGDLVEGKKGGNPPRRGKNSGGSGAKPG